MYFAFNNSYLIQILFGSNVLYDLGEILERCMWQKYVIRKLSRSEPSRSFVMQQSTQSSQTMCPVFHNSYLIQIMLKSNFLSNFEKLNKSCTWEKYIFLELKFLLGSQVWSSNRYPQDHPVFLLHLWKSIINYHLNRITNGKRLWITIRNISKKKMISILSSF